MVCSATSPNERRSHNRGGDLHNATLQRGGLKGRPIPLQRKMSRARPHLRERRELRRSKAAEDVAMLDRTVDPVSGMEAISAPKAYDIGARM